MGKHKHPVRPKDYTEVFLQMDNNVNIQPDLHRKGSDQNIFIR